MTQVNPLWLTMRSGGVLVAIGLAFGLAGSFALGSTIRSNVFSVPVTDPVAIGGDRRAEHFRGARVSDSRAQSVARRSDDRTAT
jgi:hypothetical protein